MSDPELKLITTNDGAQEVSLLSRRSNLNFLYGVSHDGNRDLNQVFGYSTNRSFQNYFELYRFGDVAQRVVAGVAKSCWSQGAEIEIDGKSQFEKELKKLTKMGLFKKLQRADILNRIGKFSVLYVGIPDGLDPEQPLGESSKASLKNLFFTPYSEDGVQITKYETDILSPRYGLPIEYTLSPVNYGEKEKDMSHESRRVHWSRIVHLAEGALDSEIEGSSCLEPIYNRCIDLNKTVGGSAEAYFRNARGKFSLETHPQFQGQISPAQKLALQEEAENFTNNWQDFMRLAGMQAKSLPTPHSSPEHTFRAAIELISGTTGIPIRVLLGVGAGQQAGSEDKLAYNQLISERQEQECEPWLYRVLEILSQANLFPEIPEEAEFKWTVPQALSSREESEIAEIDSRTLVNISSATGAMGGLAGVISPSEAVEKIMNKEFDEIDDDALDEREAEKAAREIEREKAMVKIAQGQEQSKDDKGSNKDSGK